MALRLLLPTPLPPPLGDSRFCTVCVSQARGYHCNTCVLTGCVRGLGRDNVGVLYATGCQLKVRTGANRHGAMSEQAEAKSEAR